VLLNVRTCPGENVPITFLIVGAPEDGAMYVNRAPQRLFSQAWYGSRLQSTDQVPISPKALIASAALSAAAARPTMRQATITPKVARLIDNPQADRPNDVPFLP